MLLISAALLLGMQTSGDAPLTTLTVPAGPCRVVVDGRSMSLRRFRVVARGWKRTQPTIAFQPDLKASYRCVDVVLKIVTAESLTRLGFLGNERQDEGELPSQGESE